MHAHMHLGWHRVAHACACTQAYVCRDEVAHTCASRAWGCAPAVVPGWGCTRVCMCLRTRVQRDLCHDEGARPGLCARGGVQGGVQGQAHGRAPGRVCVWAGSGLHTRALARGGVQGWGCARVGALHVCVCQDGMHARVYTTAGKRVCAGTRVQAGVRVIVCSCVHTRVQGHGCRPGCVCTWL